MFNESRKRGEKVKNRKGSLRNKGQKLDKY